MTTSNGFPKLDPGQFAVLQIDPRTGVPLAGDGTWAKTGAEYYRVFPSFGEAEAFCAAALSDKRDTEWGIYDHAQAPVRSFQDAEYWRTLNEQGSRRPEGGWRRMLSRLRGK